VKKLEGKRRKRRCTRAAVKRYYKRDVDNYEHPKQEDKRAFNFLEMTITYSVVRRRYSFAVHIVCDFAFRIAVKRKKSRRNGNTKKY